MVQLHRIRMNILQLDLNLLKILYVMLSTGSTSLTAKKLGLSASAVSHALTRLRDSLNDPLFRRVGNQQVPTLFAEKLKEKLVPLFASLNEELFGGASPDARLFRVVLPPALNVLLTPELARKGHEAEAVIECLTFERREWRDELIEEKIDLLIAVGDYQKQSSVLHYERVGSTRLVVAYGPLLRDKMGGRTALDFHELEDFEHFYCHPWPQSANELDRQLFRSGLSRQLSFICGDYSQLVPALRNAPLLAVVPAPWVENLTDRKEINVLPLRGFQAEGSVFLQYRTSSPDWKKRIISGLRKVLATHYS